MRQRTFEIFFKALHCLIFLGLLIWAVLFVSDVIGNYQSNDTSIKVSLKKLKLMQNPTITLCFKPFAKLSVLKQYNITAFTLFDFVFSNVTNSNLPMSLLDFFDLICFKNGTDLFIKMVFEEKHNNLPDDPQNLFNLEEVFAFQSGKNSTCAIF